MTPYDLLEGGASTGGGSMRRSNTHSSSSYIPMPRTALHDAKTVEKVRQALHVDVDARDEAGRTALMIAAERGGIFNVMWEGLLR